MLGPCGEASAIAGPEQADWSGFVEAAEELQMVDISLLFWRAEVVFFLNLHNALMLHTHMHRRTAAGEGLRSLKGIALVKQVKCVPLRVKQVKCVPLRVKQRPHRRPAAGEGLRSRKGTHFTCFASAKVQTLSQRYTLYLLY